MAQKFARYFGKPFECGKGSNKPGWYTWEDGAFAATLQQYEPSPHNDFSQTEWELVERGYVILTPLEEVV